MSDDITRITLDTAIESDQTDWARLRAISDADIEKAIAEDPDTFEVSPKNFEKDVGARYEVFKDAAGRYRWRLQNAAGVVIAKSAQSYSSKDAVMSAIASLRSVLLNGEIWAA